MRRRTVLTVIALVFAACAKQPAVTAPTPAAGFANAIEGARQKVDAGDYAAADRILSEYALRVPGTAEAREISFWRAMYIVDPANRTASIAQGIRALDIYLASEGSLWYRPQAEVLRRAALVIQAVRQAQAQARLGAEVSARNDKPLDWLRNGPGRETADQRGWTSNARPSASKASGAALLQAEVRDLMGRVMAALEAHPEVRAALAEELASGACQRPGEGRTSDPG